MSLLPILPGDPILVPWSCIRCGRFVLIRAKGYVEPVNIQHCPHCHTPAMKPSFYSALPDCGAVVTREEQLA